MFGRHTARRWFARDGITEGIGVTGRTFNHPLG